MPCGSQVVTPELLEAECSQLQGHIDFLFFHFISCSKSSVIFVPLILGPWLKKKIPGRLLIYLYFFLFGKESQLSIVISNVSRPSIVLTVVLNAFILSSCPRIGSLPDSPILDLFLSRSAAQSPSLGFLLVTSRMKVQPWIPCHLSVFLLVLLAYMLRRLPHLESMVYHLGLYLKIFYFTLILQ